MLNFFFFLLDRTYFFVFCIEFKYLIYIVSCCAASHSKFNSSILKKKCNPPKTSTDVFFFSTDYWAIDISISHQNAVIKPNYCAKEKQNKKTPHLHKTHLMHQQERRRSNVRDSKEFLDFRAKPGVSSTQEVMQYLPLSLDLLSE